MNRSLIQREILPLAGLFAGLVVATILLDALLHRLQLAWIGRYLGIPGVILIGVSLAYSLRKRKLIRSGNLPLLLRVHKSLAWIGTLLVLVHAGIHFNAALPWLAVGAMLVNVASGLTGTFLLNRGRLHVERRRERLVRHGAMPEDVEARLLRDAALLDSLKRWRVVHLPIALAFLTLALAHVVSVLMFWGWR